MPDIVIAGAVRTPQANMGGALKDFTNHSLGQLTVRGLLEKTKLDPNAIGEVIFGCVGQQSDAANVARVIALLAGLSHHIPAFTVARNCASGLQAITSAYQMIACGETDLVLAGGVEVMSASPYVNRDFTANVPFETISFERGKAVIRFLAQQGASIEVKLHGKNAEITGGAQVVSRAESEHGTILNLTLLADGVVGFTYEA